MTADVKLSTCMSSGTALTASAASYRASRVVAVVGAGHLPGMKQKWNSEIDFADIAQMPEQPQKSSSTSWIYWRRAALIGIGGIAVTALVTVRWRPGR